MADTVDTDGELFGQLIQIGRFLLANAKKALSTRLAAMAYLGL